MKSILCSVTIGALLAIRAIAAPGDWVGKNLPAATLEYLDEKPAAGKPMLLEFWATWCGPCRANIPHLNALNDQFKDKLAIVGISNEDRDVVEKFRESNKMNYVIALDREGGLVEKLEVTGIPQAFLVDKSGKIIWEGHPTTLTEAQIQEALK